MYGLSENGCLSFEEFTKKYRNTFYASDPMLGAKLVPYTDGGQLYQTYDGQQWKITKSYQMGGPMGYHEVFEFCPVGRSGESTQDCLSSAQFSAIYPDGYTRTENYFETEHGNGPIYFTSDGKYWVQIPMRDGSGRYQLCQVKDPAVIAQITGTSQNGVIDPGTGVQPRPGDENISPDDLDCCDYCEYKEQITEETWYLTPICEKPPCYPLNIDITKVKCITPDDGMDYEFDCDDIELAVQQINAKRGIQGMSGCDYNQLMGLGAVTPGEPSALDSAYEYISANANMGIWYLFGIASGLIAYKLLSKGQ